MEHNRKYLVIIERGEDGSYSAYVPDLPGCVAIGQDTPEQVKCLIQEAIEAHIQGLVEDGLPVPEPITQGEYVNAPAA
ncbi:MAG: type II toxin-antitoxin system HicB family antitoxin [Phycisphaerae bacterium]|nr:type II toxin-antitoxin system HicB family antitoxin [Phycisphaerae bacterium]